jgi:methylmalonyl-CoA mutase C-terminal domain/subunit
MSAPPIKVLIAKPGLDGHDIGAKIVCRALMDAGMEVIYTGLRHSAAAIATVAEEEDPDVIGLSVLSGAHLPLATKLIQELEQRGVDDALLIIGGNIPAVDHAAMRDLGVVGVFPTGTPLDEIVEFINREVAR